MNHLSACLVLAFLATPVAAQTGPDLPNSDTAPQRDPTIPSREIQRRTQARPEPIAVAPIGSRPAARPARPARVSSGPAIALQSLVHVGERCTATLRAGDQTVTVTFARNEAQHGVELPSTQFAELASTIQRLSQELAQLRAQARASEAEAESVSDVDSEEIESVDGEDELPAPEDEPEELDAERMLLSELTRPRKIDLASSFSLDGNLYQVVDFTRDSVLIEQIPMGKYIIVR